MPIELDAIALAQALIRRPSVTPKDAGALDILEKVLKELAKAQETTRALLKDQAVMEAELLKGRNAARDAYDENQKLERRIRQMEQAAPASDR